MNQQRKNHDSDIQTTNEKIERIGMSEDISKRVDKYLEQLLRRYVKNTKGTHYLDEMRARDELRWIYLNDPDRFLGWLAKQHDPYWSGMGTEFIHQQFQKAVANEFPEKPQNTLPSQWRCVQCEENVPTKRTPELNFRGEISFKIRCPNCNDQCDWFK